MAAGQYVRPSARIALPAVAIAALSWWMLWALQGMPTVCAAVYPGNCPGPGDRLAPALTTALVTLVPLVALVVLSCLKASARTRALVPVSFVLLCAVSVVGIVITLFSAGFSVPFLF